MLQLLLVRHGDPDYANDRLTELGRQEARALAGRIAVSRATTLLSSPLGRARETASYSEHALGIEASIASWAAELDELIDIPSLGYAGAAWNAPGTLLRAGVREEPATFIKERIALVMESADAFLATRGLVRTDDGYALTHCWRPDTVVLFCHAGFATAWLAHLLEIPVELVWSGLYLAPTSVTSILFERREPNTATARALSIGDISHLYASSELWNNFQGLQGLDRPSLIDVRDNRTTGQ